jgi:hypothetical protein
MDQARARALLAGERARLQRLLQAAADQPPATEREALEEGEDAVGLVSAGHPFDVLADADITPEEAQGSEEDDDEPPPSSRLGCRVRYAPIALGLQVLAGYEAQRGRIPDRGAVLALLGASAGRRVNRTSACSSLRSSSHNNFITQPRAGTALVSTLRHLRAFLGVAATEAPRPAYASWSPS